MIKLPSGHPENLDGDHTFLEWVKDASLQAPPDTSREDAGAKIAAAVALLAGHIQAYRQAVIATNGPEGADSRVQVSVRNACRRAGLGAVLGLH